MEESNPSNTVGGNVNWLQPLWRTLERFLKKPNYDPVIPLLGTYWEKTIIQKDTHAPTLTAAWFTTAKPWKQLKCPPAEEWIKMTWYLQRADYCSTIKEN